jgi:hypothetical protein
LSTSTHYTYFDLDSHENIVLYLLTDELMETTTVDPLRKEFGFDVGVARGSRSELVGNSIDALDAEESQFGVNCGIINIEHDLLREMRVVQMSTNSKYIQKMELNPARMEPFKRNTLLPNYGMPIRLYANEETTRGDKFWRTLFTGGTYADEEFPGLIDNNTIFHDYMFSFANSYPLIYSKLNQLPDNENGLKINKIQTHYTSHNINVQDYQNWMRTLKSPLLIPSFYTFQTLKDGQDQLQLPLKMYTALSASKSIYGLDSEGLTAKLTELEEIYAGSTGKDYMESIYFPTLRTKNFASETKDEVINSQKNIIFTHEYYHSMADLSGEITRHAQNWPYYNKITFPRHKQASSPTELISLDSCVDGLNRDIWFIRNAIENNKYSAKFLETLKDIHESGFAGLKFGKIHLNVEKGYDSTVNEETRVHRDIERSSYKTLDLMTMLQKMYNHQDASLNSNYTFAGAHSEGYETTYEDSGLYRYNDNQHLVGVLDDIYQTVKHKYTFQFEPWRWHSLKDSEDASDYYSVFVGQDADNEETATQAASVLNALFNPSFDHVETLAYRIEKIGGMQSQDYNTRESIQTFWVFNSSTAPDHLSFLDTQIKYDKNYTYKVSAYVAVMGIRYKYGEFRLSSQIATLDSGWDGDGTGIHIAPDGNPEYYCLQFYEPLSGKLASQFFNRGSGVVPASLANYSPGNTVHMGLAEAEGTSYSGYAYIDGMSDTITSETSALATRNIVATNEVDLSVHPQVADFMYYFEPCLKLIEIPLFSKTIKVLDNPANDMISIPFQYLDASRKIGFNLRYENFNKMRPYPVPISNIDRQRRLDYLNSRDLLPNEHIEQPALAQQRFIEVYRTDKKPTSLADFEGKLVDTIDLKIQDSYYTFPDAMYKTTVKTNQKYYYVFRFLTENLMPGHLSQILECQLIDDGNYIYSVFNVLADELGDINTLAKTSKALKKIFEIQPNISQITLDTKNMNFEKTAEEEIEKLIVGISDDLIWDKLFKIRLTSKKTGKQIDINIEYDLKEENRVNVERGDAMVRFGEISQADMFIKLAYLTGLTSFSGDARDHTIRPGFGGYYVSMTGGDADDELVWTYPWDMDDE